MKIAHVCHSGLKSFLRRWMATFLAGMLAAPCAFSFQSKRKVSVTAGAFVRAPSAPLKLQHTPIPSVSRVTKDVIVIGEAGEEVPPVLPSFSERFKPESDFGPPESRRVRMRLQFRGDPEISAQAFGPVQELPPIEGPDPLAFAFQISKSSVTVGTLQYRLVAERIQYAGGVVAVLSQTTFPPTTPSDPDPWLSVGITANAAQVFGPEGGRISLPDGNPVDGQSAIDIPTGLLQAPTVISIDEIALDNPLLPSLTGMAQPVSVYQLAANAPIGGYLQVSVLYPDFVFPQGQVGLLGSSGVPETHASLVWWDGFKWRPLGGFVNSNTNTVTVRTSVLSYFAVVPAAALAPADRRPTEKIITPNGDGVNDVAIFSFGDLASNVKVDVFDMSGRRVRTLMSAFTQSWDGRDDGGDIVESGVYIYQYNVDGMRVSGLIAVAK